MINIKNSRQFSISKIGLTVISLKKFINKLAQPNIIGVNVRQYKRTRIKQHVALTVREGTTPIAGLLLPAPWAKGDLDGTGQHCAIRPQMAMHPTSTHGGFEPSVRKYHTAHDESRAKSAICGERARPRRQRVPARRRRITDPISRLLKMPLGHSGVIPGAIGCSQSREGDPGKSIP